MRHRKSTRFAVTQNPFDITNCMWWHIDPGLIGEEGRRKKGDGNHVVHTGRCDDNARSRLPYYFKITSVTRKCWGEGRWCCFPVPAVLVALTIVLFRQVSKKWTFKTHSKCFLKSSIATDSHVVCWRISLREYNVCAWKFGWSTVLLILCTRTNFSYLLLLCGFSHYKSSL